MEPPMSGLMEPVGTCNSPDQTPAHHWRRKRASGDVIIVRYADDFVIGFQHRHEAEQFLVDLKSRLKQFGLALHPEKTRLIEFGRFAGDTRRQRGEGK